MQHVFDRPTQHLARWSCSNSLVRLFLFQPRIVVVLNLTAGLYWLWTWPKCQTSSFKVQYPLLDVRRRLINCIKSLILGVNNGNVVSVLQKWSSGGVVLSGLEKVMRKAGKDTRYEARGKRNDCTWVQFRLLVLDSAVLLLVWFKLCCIKPVDFRIFKLQHLPKCCVYLTHNSRRVIITFHPRDV